MRRAFALGVLCACRLGFDPVTGGSGDDDPDPEAGTGSSASIDAGATADANPNACAGYAPILGTFTESRYRIVMTLATWADAEAACEADGAHLAVPDDASELNGLYAALVTQAFWLGITDRINEGTWRSVTGVPAPYLSWAFNQPSAEDCVHVEGLTNAYVAQNCAQARRYICECDDVPADPSSY